MMGQRPILILASQSPRRTQILSFLSIPHKVVKPIGVDETPLEGESAPALVRRLAVLKAKAVAKKYPRQWVLAADTVVVNRGRIFGKPHDAQKARAMLLSLEGKRHEVWSGVALARKGKVESHIERTWVFFGKIPRNELAQYLKTKEAYDKAGAYAIQGTAGKWIKKWEGDYLNVMGLPVQWVLKNAGRTSV